MNNLNSMYRELESRFLVVSKEFEINNGRMGELYSDLRHLSTDNSELNKYNTELASKNKILEENKLLMTNIILSKDTMIDSQKKELEDVNNQLISLKEMNNELESRAREQESSLKLKYEEQSNLIYERDVKKDKLSDMEGIVQKQELIIKELTQNVKKERTDNEYNKNKLAVTMVQIKDLKNTNEILKKEKDFFSEKAANTEDALKKMFIEHESLNFKHNQLCKELVDTIVKMNMSLKARHGSDRINKKLMERITEVEDQASIMKDERNVMMKNMEKMRFVITNNQKDFL